MKLLWMPALLLVACRGPIYAPEERLPRDEPDGVGVDCDAMCERLAELGGCGMIPKSRDCGDACRRQMSVRDDSGQHIATLRPRCIAEIETCDGINLCEVTE